MAQVLSRYLMQCLNKGENQMARGNMAKEAVIATLREAFGNKFLGKRDKKYYVIADDGENGDVQIAISLTCPKVEIEFAETPSSDIEQDNGSQPTASAPEPVEFTQEEQDNIDRLMKMFNL